MKSNIHQTKCDSVLGAVSQSETEGEEEQRNNMVAARTLLTDG